MVQLSVWMTCSGGRAYPWVTDVSLHEIQEDESMTDMKNTEARFPYLT